MNRFLNLFLMGISLVLGCAMLPAAASADAFGSSVDKQGNISLPGNFRTDWVHLGSWMVTSALAGGSGLERSAPGQGFHDVYTQPSSVQTYKKSGAWPDGAVLIMEVRSVQWDDLPTGHVMVQGDPVKWLVMVKDRKGRFSGNPHWGDGWGWAVFKPNDTSMNLSAGYKTECRGCHEPAKDTDWIFLQGYPAIR